MGGAQPVDRFAIFIDAGYALVVGARIACGYPVPRSAATVDYGKFVQKLIDAGRATCGEDLLRVYWYDGAIDQVPTTQHQTLGALPNVKVRLGRLVGGGQKGVDTLVVLDLTTLARERAISTAFVMSGDEDLREGVAVAQQLGVRVVLWGLEPIPSTELNQALTLIREADAHTVLDSAAFVAPFFTQVKKLPVAANSKKAIEVEAIATNEKESVATVSSRALDVGREFIADWLAAGPSASAVEALRQAKEQYPRRIPAGIDAELLARGRIKVANPLSEDQKRELRRGFWELVD
jgi:uncharacterized LabA/DUF88 family protein